MNKIKYISAFFILCFLSCDTPVVTFPQKDNGPIIEKAFADGSGNGTEVISPTTKITFVFNEDMNGLQAEDIHLEAVFPFIKDKLTEINKKTFELAVIPGKSGLIRATVSPYTFTGWSVVSVQVYADYDFIVYYDNSKLQNCLRITGYNNISKTVNIPENMGGYPVTWISSGVFQNKELTDVTINNGIEIIERAVFSNNLLTEIEIPDSITNIGGYAFYFNKLTSVTLSENVTSIGVSAFGSNEIKDIEIPSGILSLAGFDNNMLSFVDVPETVEYIEDSAFMNNNITVIDLKEGIKYIKSNAFAHNLLINVTIPPTVTELGGFNNNRLTGITIPESVITVGTYAFANNQITEIEIPENVITVGSNAFANNKITKIDFDNAKNLRTIGEGAFQNNQLTCITIPGNVAVYGQAFTGNQLTEITINIGVTLHGIVFGNGFEVFLRSNGNIAGIYKREDADTNDWEYIKLPEE